MRTYDPADHIRYVHPAADPAALAAPRDAQGECHRLPAGYANRSVRISGGEPPTATDRPALVVLPGGLAPAPRPPSAPPELRLAR